MFVVLNVKTNILYDHYYHTILAHVIIIIAKMRIWDISTFATSLYSDVTWQDFYASTFLVFLIEHLFYRIFIRTTVCIFIYIEILTDVTAE